MTGALHDGAVTGSRRGIWLAAAAAALVAFGADLLTKVAVRDRIVPGEEIDLFAGVTLVHTTNRGIAFGILPNRPVLIAIATSVALCVIAFALIAFARRSLPVLIGGGILVGGSIGNLVDRLARQGVTDFIAITDRWPPFNVADICIVVGAALAATGLVAGADERT